MFNEKIKNEYLSGLSGATAKSQKSYFSKIEDYEQKLQKDVVFFSEEEFSELIQNIKGLSMGSSLYNFVSCLRNYGKWYSENHSPIDHCSVFNVDYSKILPFYYKSSAELISDIDAVIRSKISEYGVPLKVMAGYMKEIRMKYNVAIGVILLTWCGLTLDEIRNLKSENIFNEEKCIYSESRDMLLPSDDHVMRVLSQIKTGTSYIKIEKEENDSEKCDNYILTSEDFHYTEFFLKKRGKSADYEKPVSTKLIDMYMTELNNNLLGKMFQLMLIRENGMFCRAYEKSKITPCLRFKRGENDEDYYAIFDDRIRNVGKRKFSDIKYRYKAFIKLLEADNTEKIY